jgi:autotransporter-associated beta strand protein
MPDMGERAQQLLARPLRAVAAGGMALAALTAPACAQDASWLATTNIGNWNDVANWSPNSVPTGTASFPSVIPARPDPHVVIVSQNNAIGRLDFVDLGPGPGYSFRIAADLNVTGAGFTGTPANVSFQVGGFGGPASLNFQNSSSSGSVPVTTFGTTTFSGNSSGGTSLLTIRAGGAVDISGLASVGMTVGMIAAEGNLFLGSKNLRLIGASDAEFSGVIADGGLNGGAGGSLTINLDPNAIAAGGQLTLSGINTYTGGTTVISGTLVVAGGATLGAATAPLTIMGGRVVLLGPETVGTFTMSGGAMDHGTLNATAFNVQAGTIDSILAGPGALTKTGAGTVTLNAVNTYAAPTTVNGGLLSVNGSIASSSLTTVNSGGTLGGNGTLGNTSINGGTLAPGNSIGVLTVQGNLVFATASSYMVEVSPTNADRTNVTGTATLGGATVSAAFAAGSYVARQYVIVNATGGVTGTFAALTNTNLPPGFTSSLSYDASNAYLNLDLTFAAPGGALNGNQQNVANAVTGFFAAGGSVPIAFGALGPAGLTQVSGETATASQQTTFDAMSQFMGVMTDPFIAGRGVGAIGSGPAAFAAENDAASAYAASRKRSGPEREAYAAIYNKAPPRNAGFDPRWSVWAAGLGGSQSTDGNALAGSNNTTSWLGAVAVGADYLLSPATRAGFALAGGATRFSVTNGGSGRSDLFQAGAFVRHTVGPAYVAAALAYGWQDITTDRTVTVAGIDRLRAEFNANAWSGRLEGGYRLIGYGIGLTPYAAGQFTTFDLPSYAEQAVSGANTFALSYGARSVTASRSELGVRTDRAFVVQEAILTLRGRAAWAHDFNSDRNIAATFQTLPGASFVVNGAAQAHDAALATAAAELKWRNGLSLAAVFEGEFSGVTQSYAGKAVARYAW